MKRQPQARRGRAPIAALVLLVAFGLLLAFLVVKILQARESGRAMRCSGNINRLGKAIIMYDEQNRELPKSNLLPENATGKIEGEGWSWAYEVTSFMDLADLHGPWDLSDTEPRDAEPVIEAIAAADIEVFRCPSFSSGYFVKKADATPWRNSDRTVARSMISHYKALAATTDESLQVAYGGDEATVGYNKGTHPDGAINPETSYTLDGLTDGTTGTILIGESAEPFQSRWCFGDEMEMVAMDKEKVNLIHHPPGDFIFAYPAGFNPRTPLYFNRSEIKTNPKDGTGQAFVSYNYSGTKKAPSYAGVQATNADALFGPSSHHPLVVMHVYGDNSVGKLSKKIDAAAYMFMVTRASGDPD